MLEVAIQRRRHLRAHAPPTLHIEANFEIALDALSDRSCCASWRALGRRVAGRHDHVVRGRLSHTPRGVAHFDRAASAMNCVLGMSVGSPTAMPVSFADVSLHSETRSDLLLRELPRYIWRVCAMLERQPILRM